MSVKGWLKIQSPVQFLVKNTYEYVYIELVDNIILIAENIHFPLVKN